MGSKPNRLNDEYAGQAPSRRPHNNRYVKSPEVEEWIERSNGKLRADKALEKLLLLGYGGSERTTRRAVARVKKDYRLGRVPVHRP